MNRPVGQVLDELERSCVEAEAALREQRWRECDVMWSRQRRLTHELEVALRDLPMGTPERRAAFARIDRIAKYRDNQVRRLRAFQAATAKRLATLERFRRMSKSVGEVPKARLIDSSF